MNILLMVDSASTLFQKKVNVTLVHAESKAVINNHALNDFPLPEQFNKPTILDIENTRWRIVKVETLRSGNYFRSAKVQLYVLPPDSIVDPNKFLVPTLVPREQIITTDAAQAFNDFTLHLSHDEWLQFEFLPLSNIEQIQETTAIIESIINAPDENNNLWGYSSYHIRDLTWNYRLGIPFEDFCGFTGIADKGNIVLSNAAFVKNGFALRSSDHIYYGIVNNGVITKLAIKNFDCLDEELSNVLSKYGLTFVDWCNASILS
ncbi:hypothetical protein L3C95_04500 [Chitinophaga filiformis]|uniref:hypothetical protein n=1 Tax=Chitinophaga filiformis TaxID=104663 RepID=UPI001F44A1BC|nr:hypothetical protein [Chitinophaga filiformis]MCF6402121.1 hypothetical protein [Chitinophaga filiformis]